MANMLQEICDFLLKLSSSKKKKKTNKARLCGVWRESSNIFEAHKIPKRLKKIGVTRCFELVSNAKTRSMN